MAVLVQLGRQHSHTLRHLQEIPLEGGSHAGQLVAGGGIRHHQAVLVIIDHQPVPIGHFAGPLGVLLQLHLVERLGKEGLVSDAGVGAPVVLCAVPLQVVAPNGVLDVVAPFRGGGKHLPAGVYIIQGGTGIFRPHGELLAVCCGEGIVAVPVHAHRPHVAGREAGQYAAGESHIGALVVETSIAGGQGLPIGRVINDHMVPCRQHRLLRLRGIGGVHWIRGIYWSPTRELVQGKLRRIACRVTGNGGRLISPEFIFCALIAGQEDGIHSLPGELEGPIGAGNQPTVIASNNAIVIATFGCSGNAVAVRQLDCVPVYGDGPGENRTGHCIAAGVYGLSCNPAVFINARAVACVYHHYVLAGSQLFHGGDFGVGRSLRSKGRCGQHGQNHGHQQQPRQESAPGVCVHIHPPFLFLPFGSVWGDCLNYHTTSSGNALLPVSTFYQNLTLFVRIGKHIMKFALSWPQSIFCGPGRKWPGILPLSGKYILTKHIQSLIMEWCG
ncbi:unknown [Firmicutes bacterium CAG:137]|nr:unknown [Firmicutes bacterium CAG:137]